MEVILLETAEKLGKAGEVVKVNDGYARNFLIPKKIATPYDDATAKMMEAKKKKEAQKAERQKKCLLELAKAVSNVSLTVPVESGPDDAIFGSVTTEAISLALKNEGIDVDKKSIDFIEPIKKLGVYTVSVKLHPEIKENLKLWVVKK